MKILLISDTHDHVGHLELLKKQGHQIDALIHTGDLCSAFMLRELSSFGVPVIYVMGNGCEDEMLMMQEAQRLEITGFVDVGVFDLGGKRFAITHYPKVADELARKGLFDVIIYGHSHRQEERRIGNTHLINPGNLVGWREKSRYALYDTASDEVSFYDLQTKVTHYHFED